MLGKSSSIERSGRIEIRANAAEWKAALCKIFRLQATAEGRIVPKTRACLRTNNPNCPPPVSPNHLTSDEQMAKQPKDSPVRFLKSCHATISKIRILSARLFVDLSAFTIFSDFELSLLMPNF